MSSKIPENTIEAAFPPYRRGTKIAKIKMALIYNAGGIGDYIHWTGAIKYAIDSNPHIEGYVVAPEYFYDLADLWLGNYSERFKVISHTGELKGNKLLEECAAIIPNNQQLANACGFHLTELGFIYYTQKKHIVKGYETIPIIKGNEADISHFNLPKDYVVIPTEATSENRRIPSETINAITKHLISRGITPVFLGKHKITEAYKASGDADINVRGTMDLREKTSLREAACIMARAKFVLGLDGGLLHLACCSMVPVIFAFTTVHPEFRVPKRQAGAKTTVVVPPENLECRFCNSGDPHTLKAMSYVIGHDFKNCLYKDNLCTKLIEARTFIPIIDKLLETKS